MTNLQAEIGEFCKRHHLRLNTDLGQHFLIDEEILGKIVEAAEIEADEHVVEIGSGIGILTKELLKRTPNVTVIEIDERMIPLLKEYLQTTKLPTIVVDNALKVPMPEEPYKIVANIPYHITSPLLRHVFLESKRAPVSMTLLIQREVAEKICSETDAGMLTVLVKLFGIPRIITKVPASCFLPPPRVDSAVMQIHSLEHSIAEPEVIEQVFALTKVAFGQKRKMLRNTIGYLPRGAAACRAANIHLTRRPQTLSVEEWVELAKAFLF